MNSSVSELSSHFRTLCWEALVEWAGEEVSERGKAEVQQVRRLALMPDGGLLATVVGIRENVVNLWFDKEGELLSECTCAEGCNCHHAISAALVCMERLSAGESIPPVAEDDPRIHALDVVEAPSVTTKKAQSAERNSLAGYIQTLSRTELIQLSQNILAEFPTVKTELLHEMELQRLTLPKLCAQLQKELGKIHNRITQKVEDIYSSWRKAPNFIPIFELLFQLYDREQYEEFLNYGLEVTTQVTLSNRLASCGITPNAQAIYDKLYNLFPKALAHSTRSEAAIVAWKTLACEFYIDGDTPLEPTLLKGSPERHSPEFWNEVCDVLLAFASEHPWPLQKDYNQCLYPILRIANRRHDIIKHCATLPLHTTDFPFVITECLEAGFNDQALHWCGLYLTVDPELDKEDANVIIALTQQILRQKQDFRTLATYLWDVFYSHPTSENYALLREAAIQVNVWEKIQPIAYHIAYHRSYTKNPLGDLPFSSAHAQHSLFHSYVSPETHLKIELIEKNFPKALSILHKLQTDFSFGLAPIEIQVALAIQESDPYKALEILTERVKSEIRYPTRSSDDTIATCLSHLRELYLRIDRYDEWASFVKHICVISTHNSLIHNLQKLLDLPR